MSDVVTDSLPQLLAEAITRHTAEDNIAKLVDAKIGEVIKQAVETSLKSWGNVGKQIETAVSDALQIRGPLDVPSYSNMVLVQLRQTMDAVLQPLLAEKMAASMAELLKVGDREVKLSDVVKTMVDSIEVGDRFGTYATAIVESSEYSSGYTHIALDRETKTRKFDCELQFGVTDRGEIYTIRIDQKDVKKTLILGHLEEYQRLVFAAYATGAKFIIDVTEPYTGIGDF